MIKHSKESGVGMTSRLYGKIKDRIFREFVLPLLPGGGEMPSKKELAAKYRVSVGTLDKALQELSHEGYIEKRVGSGTYVLPHGRHGSACIGIYTRRGRLTEDWKQQIFNEMLNVHVQEELESSGREFRHYADMRLDSACDKPPPSLVDDIKAGRISSVIAFGYEEKQKSWLGFLNVPVVSHGFDFGWGCAASDMLDGGFSAASALISAGSSRIELLSVVIHEWVSPGTAAATNRPLRAGMANALRAAGLPAPDCWMKPDTIPSCVREMDHGMPAEDVGYELCKALFSYHNPDGLIVFTDILAIGVARALKELGLKVGRDVHVAVLCNEGIDFPELAGFIRVEFPIKELTSSLVSLASAAECGDEPRELRVKFRT